LNNNIIEVTTSREIALKTRHKLKVLVISEMYRNTLQT